MSVVLGSRPVGTPEAETILASPRFDTAGRRAICGWGQSVTLLLAAILFLGSLGCTRSEPPQFVPPPSPAATKTPTPEAKPPQAPTPTPSAAEDDHSDVASSATSLSLFRAVAGSIDHPGDVDLFVFQGVYGVTFEIVVDAVTLSDGVLTIYGPDAECVLSEIDQLSGSDRATLRWRFAETAPHYVSVQGASDVDTATGAYTLILTTTQEEPDDDHGDAVCSASTAVVGLSYSGMIEHSADVDVLGFEVTAGTLYRAVVQLGTLGDSRLVLLDKDGETELDRSEEFGESSLEWTPSESGTYYLIVEGGDGAFNPEGTYILTVSDQMPSPTPSPTPIPPGPSPTPAMIQAPHGPMVVYESADNPFSLQYPADWAEDTAPRQPGVVAAFVGPEGESLAIVVQDLAAAELGGATLTDYVDLVLSEVSLSSFNFELVSREGIVTDQGMNAELVEYSVLGGTNQAFLFVYLGENGIVFTATYMAPSARYEAMREQIVYSFDTFRDRSAPEALPTPTPSPTATSTPTPSPTPVPPGSMTQGRYGHTATLLPDGRVLVLGGEGIFEREGWAELFDPESNVWSVLDGPFETRWSHAVALLRDGRVLIVGGMAGDLPAATAELFDPREGSWSPAASMESARLFHTATVLPNGQVLVVGDVGPPSTELYDVLADSWATVGALSDDRIFHTATVLRDGRVLVVGGQAALGLRRSAEVFDPLAVDWSVVGEMAEGRSSHSATLLEDGRVLVAGGLGQEGYLASAELYDPSKDTWSPAGSMNQARSSHTATVLDDDTILVTGGLGVEGQPISSTELFDPSTGTWRPAAELVHGRAFHTATLLANGNVLVVGGLTPHGSAATSEVYDPVEDRWAYPR